MSNSEGTKLEQIIQELKKLNESLAKPPTPPPLGDYGTNSKHFSAKEGFWH